MLTEQKKVVFTYQDLVNWQPDRCRHELIAGDHYMSPSPTVRHQDIVFELGCALREYVLLRRLGRVLMPPLDLVFSPTNVLVPDLIFVSTARQHIIGEKYLTGAPDLVVEVLSSGTAKRDRTVKRKCYAQHGVQEYWLVDPTRQLIEVVDLATGRVRQAAGVGQQLSTPLFPDLALDVARVFATPGAA